MNGERGQSVKSANDNVEPYPRECQPPRPVVTAEDEDAGQHRQEPDEFEPKDARKRAGGSEFGQVESEPDGAGKDVHPSDDGDRERTAAH